jgi:hypothetical protein
VDRPEGKSTVVTVLPISHIAPKNDAEAVEIPQVVKKHLGLNDARSWVIVSEGNDFVWPGYDLRRRKDGSYSYGFRRDYSTEPSRRSSLGMTHMPDCAFRAISRMP